MYNTIHVDCCNKRKRIDSNRRNSYDIGYVKMYELIMGILWLSLTALAIFCLFIVSCGAGLLVYEQAIKIITTLRRLYGKRHIQ